MAEPMSSTEIEDVLSSIRRLVAQDLKPSDRARLAAVADATQKLVLAPDQRIEDAAGSDQPPAMDAKFVTVRRPSRRAVFPPVDAVLAGVAALAGSDRRAGNAEDDPQAQDWALGAEAARRAEAEAAAQARAEKQAFAARAFAAHMGAAAGGDAGSGANAPQPPAQPDDLQGPAPSHSAPSNTAPPDFAQSPDYEEDFEIDPNARMFDVVQGVPSAGVFAYAPPKDDEPDEVDAAHMAAPDTDAGQSLHGTIEPDPHWADSAEARVIAELAGEAVQDEVFDRAAGSFRAPNFSANAAQPPAEVLFDEDQLRAMVQAIFREEMAGPMGERITRNIRKLVRAEVGRMMAAQELE